MNRARSQPTAQAEATKDASVKAPKRRGNRSPGRRESTLGAKTSTEANRRAAVILTVLAGERLPSEAAEVLGVSVTHYYILERKALEGLLRACERKPQGPPGPTAERQVAQLERQLEQARRECQRQAALVRSTQRALGLPVSSGPPGKAKSKSKDSGGSNGQAGGRKRRRRKPTVRALRAAETLAKNSSLSKSADGLHPSAAVASTTSSPAAQEGS
jgi:transposase